ncbi:uncharacterized protein DNG_08642 [Cephalotrichum gorgonifer]|uniref:Protein kinase domain-containing protein n=1 Tax=Cephalotrichum gorgonifer TaxID=2041049 RepID=A0AAE8SYN2_9PEZI|nr:uncharacterized protein DNG_08642 [Cephalotrichum gorgonifer]
MAQGDAQRPTSSPGTANFLRRLLFGSPNATSTTAPGSPTSQNGGGDDEPKKNGLIRRVSRKVVPGLPRMQTFKRQQSEKRVNLAPVEPTPAERRAMSVDRRTVLSRTTSRAVTDTLPRASAPDFLEALDLEAPSTPSLVSKPSFGPQAEPLEKVESHYDDGLRNEEPWSHESNPMNDVQSITSSLIQDELETRWILNLSMHFRDKSNREKFFVTYREADTLWRRVTISLDYRKASENSLEKDLMATKYQRDKSSKIYEAIRDSLDAISFYDTVTNLKLQTTDGRLHVHVAEDLNEIITFPLVREVNHLRCHKVRERDIVFDSHMSGFVYKVRVGEQVLIKKEIPGPDTINEFIYEINALYSLGYSNSVIDFFGVVVDDEDQHVKGLLISYAEQGTLVDAIYEHQPGNEKGLPPLPWSVRARWAKQVVQGLADIHESGFVQGDFTLSNIVIDGRGDAKIIDINRRGCPVGWEPPEARPLIKSSQGISMYIGVKSDLYQLGMVLWALAMEEDEPEKYGPGLVLDPDADVPLWYRRLVDICLSDDPRMRIQASSLLSLFPAEVTSDGIVRLMDPSTPEGYDSRARSYSPERVQTNDEAEIWTVSPSDRYRHHTLATPAPLGSHYVSYDSPYPYPTRGRSPPRPLPSDYGYYDVHGAPYNSSWTFSGAKASYSDAGLEDGRESRMADNTARKGSVGEAHGSQGDQLPGDSGDTAEASGERGDDKEDLLYLAIPDAANERSESRKGKEAVVSWNDTLADGKAGNNHDVPEGPSTDADGAAGGSGIALNEGTAGADQGAIAGPTENVGDLEGKAWNFTGGLGILAEMGNTVPTDPTANESRPTPGTAPMAGITPEDQAIPADPGPADPTVEAIVSGDRAGPGDTRPTDAPAGKSQPPPGTTVMPADQAISADTGLADLTAGETHGPPPSTILVEDVTSRSGILSADTGPADPAASEVRDEPNTVLVEAATSEDQIASAGPAEPATAEPSADDGSMAVAEIPVGHGVDEAGCRVNQVEEVPQSPLPRVETLPTSCCEKPRTDRSSDGAISDLAGVGGGVDEDAQGDPTHFPASLDEEPGLMTVPTKMATMTSAQRGPEESISSPISVGH